MKDVDKLSMHYATWIVCGRCERVLDYIPTDGGRITVDGLMMIREAGWEHNGISWDCDGCVAELESGE